MAVRKPQTAAMAAAATPAEAKLGRKNKRLEGELAKYKQAHAELAAALMASRDEAQRFKAHFVQQRTRADEAEQLVIRWRTRALRVETELAARAEPIIPRPPRRPAAAPLPFTDDEDQDETAGDPLDEDAAVE